MPKPKKPKPHSRTVVAKIAEEWKRLPLHIKASYKNDARYKMQKYKADKREAQKNLMDKAREKRENGSGIVKKVRQVIPLYTSIRTTYNYYIKDQMRKAIDSAKSKGEKIEIKVLFKQVAYHYPNVILGCW